MNGSQKNKAWYRSRWAYYFYLILLAFPLSEIAARIVGYRPYYIEEYTITSSPSNSLLPDSILGLALAPGAFEVTINKGLTYTATHDSSGYRQIPHNNAPAREDTCFFMGCSFTYGMGVNDQSTFAAICQKGQSKYEIVNFGVPGYGTVQSLLQLEDALRNGSRPDLVIMFFSKLHFDRNVLAPSFRKALKHGYERSARSINHMADISRFPYFEIEENRIKSIPWKSMYTNWTGRENFAIINYLNSNVDKANREKLDPVGTTKQLFTLMHELCIKHDVRLNVCFLDEDKNVNEIRNYCERNGVTCTSISLTHNDPEYTNLPFDSHPNEKGHERIAKQIMPWLDQK